MRVRRSLGLLAALLSAFLLLAGAPAQASGAIRVVAAEDFYGDIVTQIGGDLVTVISVMSDPNVDPHEYESNVEDAKAVADADLVIENGGGYDDWMDRLLSASPRASRVVLKGYDLAVKKLPDNEHVWYSLDNMQAIARAVSRSLQKLLPRSAAVFAKNDRVFQESLVPLRQAMARMAGRYAGTPIGLTETVFLYQALPLGLKVLTPFEFQKAVAEGNDPSARAAVETENQIRTKQVKILVYNEQTVTPLTSKVQADARAANIPMVGVTETMPQGETYQTWMMHQLDELRSALVSATGS
jgi:zinc/manganese transport system substrate-binding protein